MALIRGRSDAYKQAWGDEVVLLSTCSYHTVEGRFVLCARRLRDGEALPQNHEDGRLKNEELS